MSGLDLKDTLGRGDNALPIIFITGHGDLSIGVEAMKTLAVDSLADPVRLAEKAGLAPAP